MDLKMQEQRTGKPLQQKTYFVSTLLMMNDWRDVFTGGKLLVDWLTPKMVDSAFPSNRGG